MNTTSNSKTKQRTKSDSLTLVAYNKSDEITIDSTGYLKVKENGLQNIHINSAAAIDYSKLAVLTASRALVSNGSGVLSVSSITSIELSYLSGVSSNIQTQINGTVKTTTDQSISGIKTFTQNLRIPTSQPAALSDGDIWIS